MRFFSQLFKKPDPPEPYDWAFLKQACLDSMDSLAAPKELVKSPIDVLDEGRLSESGDAEDVVVEIWAVLTGAKIPKLSASQRQEYLWRAGEMLRSDVGPTEALLRLQEIEEQLRKK